MGNLEEIMLMEGDDNKIPEEYDFSIVDDYAVCQRCKKVEQPEEEDEYGAEDGVYHCYKCREEIPLENYFKSLKSKGLLEQYGSWIMKVHPEFKKYILN
ncbi:MAG: hypothetical protein AABY32_04690 [Nanoarchaeota archaeon]